MRFAGIIPAAGLSTRFGDKQLKQDVLLGGKRVLQWSIDALRTHCEFLCVAVPADELHRFASQYSGVDRFVVGGATRAQSVGAALQALPDDLQAVLVHDAARPAVSPEIILRVKAAVTQFGAAIAAVPVVDTLKQVNAEKMVEATLDRSKLWAAQTPQGFRLDWYREAWERFKHVNVTDDATWIELLGKQVHVVLGDETNRKLTTPDDVAFLAGALSKHLR